ncbi:MAG: tRNA (N(6)-L-threonylcarbamoyladenosine(37)-C(2))-methylthiotransferase MtaB [Oscillospiraceae bacterium]|nr:tRNA (N(6)-L-threonylcarbamoyladenosine(37)-C(2))-methylthiotransferase MtaB [Oscillospiraceae bacterium]
MKVFIHTLGCKVNQYETGAMETLLRARGHEIVPSPAGCDAVVVNTCAVTAESERKSRQAVRRYAAEAGEGAITAVCGCCAQVSPETAEKLGADLIGGSGGREAFVLELERVFETRTKSNLLDDALRRRAFEALPSGSEAGRTRAMLKIEDGCLNFCAYCIIPYARGPVRSMPLPSVAAEAADLQARGFREIVVTGIEIASYGRDLPEKPGLADAVKAAAGAAPEARIRLGSLEPRIVTEDFCRTLAALKNVCPHFHLSLQSGCDATLLRMRRRYDTALFFDAVTRLRRYFPGCAVAADLICGFPGETDGEFRETMAFIEKCAFSSMHVFPYSVRPGTAAAVMDGQVPYEVKKARAGEAGRLAHRMRDAYCGACVGKTLTVLFETEEQGRSRGHAENYCEVEAEGAELRGQCAEVTINSAKNGVLFGKICL